MFNWNKCCFVLILLFTEMSMALSSSFGFDVVIQKPDNTYLEAANVDFKFSITDDSGTCVLYVEEHTGVDMTGTNGQKSFQVGNVLLQTYPNPLVTTLSLDKVFNSSGQVYSCQGGGIYSSSSTASRKLVLEFNDGSGVQTLPAMAINSVPYAQEAKTVVANSINSSSIIDGSITAADLSSMGASPGQVLKWSGASWVASTDLSGSGLVSSVAGRTGAVTLSSSDISGLGTLAGKNQIALSTDVTGSLPFANLAQSSATTGQVIKWNGSAWVASSDDTGAGGIITSVTASGPLSSSGGGAPNITITQANGTTNGYLTSTDWTTFNAKLSNFSTLTSGDITGKLGYTPLANFGSMTSNDVTTALTYTPVNKAGDTMSGTLNLPSNGLAVGTNQLIVSGGNVGIGLTNPSHKLDVNGSLGVVDFIYNINNSAQIALDNSKLTFYPNGSPTVIFDGNGRVGIGTTTPGSKLTIDEGDLRISSDTYSGTDIQVDNHFDSSEGPFILLRKTRGNKAAQTYPQMGDTLGAISFQNKDYVESAAIMASATAAHNGTTANSMLIFKTTSGTTSATRMLIDELGRIGVGLPSPSYSVDVSGDVNVTGNFKINGVNISSGTVTSVTASGPLSSSGGATPNITITQANGTTNGYLSSTDWTTFNSKQAALGYTPLNPSNNLSDVANAATSRTNLGLGTASSPTFTGLTLSGVTGNTLVKSNGSGVLSNATSADVTGLLGYTPQPVNTELTGLAGLSTTGFIRRTAAGAYSTVSSIDLTSQVSGSLPFTNLAQSSATTGQVIKWNGSAWVASTDLGLTTSAEITTALTYTPVNKAGDTMSGTLNLPSNGLAVGTNQLIVSSGNTGLGINSPQAKLHVGAETISVGSIISMSTQQIISKPVDGDTVPLYLINSQVASAGSTNETVGLGFGMFNGGNDVVDSGKILVGKEDTLLGNPTTKSFMSFYTNNAGTFAEKMRITSAGNVGIGTTAPTAKLDIGTSANVIPISISNSADTAVATPLLLLNQGQGGGAYSRQPAIAFSGPWSVTNPTQYYATIKAYNDNGGPGAGAQSSLRFATSSGDPAVLSDKMTITGPGNVGIGTTSPSAPLHTVGEMRSSGATNGFATVDRTDNTNKMIMYLDNGLLKFDDYGGQSRMVINRSSGNVGIGTTAPLAPLTVLGSGSGTTVANSGSSDATMNFRASRGTVGIDVGMLDNGTGYVQNRNIAALGTTYDLSLQPNGGNLGVGTITPRATLDVSGPIVSRASQSFAAGTIDFSASNLRHTTQNCGSFALHNLKDGGTYMFAVQGTTVATCSFTAFSDAGSTALTVHMPPDHGATTSGKHTIYNIAVLGTHVYIAWTPGY